MATDLDQCRHEAADHEFETYDFGDTKIGEVDGWAFVTPGSEYSRIIWFQNEQDPDGPDLKGHFTVHFASDASAEIIGAYASLNGNDIGHRQTAATPELKP